MHAVSVTMETEASSGTEFVSMPLLLIKDEPHDDPEMADTNFPPIVTEPDPMNLLDPMDDSAQENPADSDETSDQQQQQAGLTAEIWQAWMAEYPWLLHEEADENEGYCLYCNIKVSYKLTKTPRNHALSRNHREYEENYLAFKASEDQANMSNLPNAVTIKQEFGTDSDISAIKFKRMSQTEPLFNFIWCRWLKRHTWLERDKDDMTHGYCKYCKLRICVEYSYMRMRHEVGIKHRIAVKRARKSNGKKKFDQSEEQDQNAKDAENESEPEKEQSELGEQEEDEEAESENGKNNETESTGLSNKESEEQDDAGKVTLKRKRRPRGSLKMNPWLELHGTTPQFCRCKLCNVKMHASNFQRHLHTQVHQERERNLKTKNMAPNIKQEISIKTRNWKVYAKKHHWLVEDPEDANFAYCKYCKKRLLHGIHPMKRLIHERGEHHKGAVKKHFRNMRRGNVKGNSKNENDEEQEEEEEEDQTEADENNQDAETDANNEEDEENSNDDAANDDNDENENDDDENEDDENDDDEDQADKSKTRHPFGTDEWYAMFPWCQRYKEDPKYMYCSYCKSKLKLTFRRKQHESTTRHQEAAKAVKALQSLSNLERSRQDRRIKYYPWLVYTKNPQYVFCKYCRVRLSSGVGRAKHETTKRHRESAAAFNSKNESPTTNTSTHVKQYTSAPSLSRSKPLVTAQPPRSIKTKITMWRHKFAWLTYKRNEMQPNYGYCKYCEMRVYLLTEKFALKHQKSLKHIRIRMQLKRQEQQQAQVEQVDSNEQTTTETETEKPSDHDFAQQNKDYPWLLPDKQHDSNYGFCKYCKVRLNITGGLRNRHQQTIKHSKAVLETDNEEAQKVDSKRKTKDSDNASDAVVVLDDDDMNDNSVKMEPMSEDDVLEYLLQRSEQAKTSKVGRNTNTDDTMEPPNKRQQTSSHDGNLIDRARRLTTAHLEILRLSRDLNDGKTPKKSGHISLPTSIFNTSAAIAALLSPPQAPPTPATPPTRNNFELFFDSVCESVKTLPSDLAAEGKIKIAQLVADLEMRALQRSQCKDYQNSNAIQITATPMSSGTSNDNASPTLSNNTDVPSTTTNGLDKEHTSPPLHTETPQQQSMSSYSLDSNLRIIPISSTPNYRHSDATTDTNVRRMQMGTPQVTTTQIKRIQINPAYQQPAVKPKTDGSASRMQAYGSNTPTTAHPVQQRTQNLPSISTPSTQSVYQHAQQIVSSSPDSVGSPRGMVQSSHTHNNNASLIDNGIRRIHLGSRPQPQQAPQQPTQDLGFRRIHLPFKGTTITKTSTNANTNTNTNTNTKPTSSTFYINHSQNA